MKAVLRTMVPRRSTGEWISRRPMAWLREIGVDLVDFLVKTDTEPALVSLVEHWSSLRAMKGGSRMLGESSTVSSSLAEHARLLLMRFEVGHDGKTAYERLKGKAADMQRWALTFCGRHRVRGDDSGNPLA